MHPLFEIEFSPTDLGHDIRIADRFDGGWETIEAAKKAESETSADLILREAYRGSDANGIGVYWSFI